MPTEPTQRWTWETNFQVGILVEISESLLHTITDGGELRCFYLFELYAPHDHIFCFPYQATTLTVLPSIHEPVNKMTALYFITP